jgi:TRAP-type C4-dicarboxylate transport system permease small subunit
VIDRFAKVLEALIASFLALMALMVFGNVVLRYGFNSGITFSEEASRYVFVWLIFLSAAVAVKDRTHLGMDTVVVRLPPAMAKAFKLASNVLMQVATALLLKGCWVQMVISMGTKSPVSGIPVAIVYLAGVVASVLIIVLLIRDLYRLLSRKGSV